MTRIKRPLALLIAAVCATSACADDAAKPLSFSKDVLPILAGHCYACHGADESSREAELRLDVRERAVESGAIVPDQPEQSELLNRIFSEDHDLVMPPVETKRPLSEKQKETLRRWIQEGAQYEAHWAFQAPQRPELPSVKNNNWPQNSIDHFVLAQLENVGLQPAPPAEPHVLFRRLSFDLTGLPPNPEDLKQFEQNYSADAQQAVSDWIDRLMARPGWGEHRGRYWLDAARYADTHGLHFDNYREMWAYRDWVIRAFNSNMPYDQFTVDQLAGDLHEQPTRDQLIATGFQRCNITTNEGGTIAEENLANYAADRVQTFGWVYLGLTTNCCQCHDHKFDPLTTKDYYSLAAYFRNTTQGSHDGNVKDGRGPVIKVYSTEDELRLAQIQTEQKSLTQKIADRRQQATAEFEAWLTSAAENGLKLPTENQTLWLPLNDGEGNAISVHAEETTNLSAQNTKWVKNGVAGPALKITADSVVTVGDYGRFERDQPFSISVRVRSDNKRGNAPVIARMDESSAHRGWDLWREGDEFAIHLIDSWSDNAIKVRTTGKTLALKKWQHVVATYDGSGKVEGIRIYVDGQSRKLQTLTNTLKPDATFATDVPLKIGQRSSGGVLENAAVQDLRLFDAALSAEDVAALETSGAIMTIVRKPANERTEAEQTTLQDHFFRHVDQTSQQLHASVAKLTTETEQIEQRTPVTHVQKEKADSMPMAHILMRGAYDRPGEEVTAAPPAALHPLPKDAEQNRMGLARWVVDRSNPLTARVTVNRFWQEVFGQGLVATPDDFGLMGARPSHPKLLDWLAVEFVDSGWDVQHLFRLMLTSATYQQAALNSPDRQELDRDNRLLSRGPRFRLDAEMIRDFALSTSGLLSRKMYGPGTKPYQPENIWNVVGLPNGDTRNYVQDTGENLYRRSLYTFWKRMAPPPALETLNAPSREVCSVRRERTNTPLQALVTLNDTQFVEAARRLAENAISQAESFDQRLDFVTLRLLARRFNERERAIAASSFEQISTHYSNHPHDAEQLIKVGESEVVANSDPGTLAAWTMLANQLMNLDEALNK
ncbi:MAG: DUF1553 domain-containing protein [Fuerstiella sp.]